MKAVSYSNTRLSTFRRCRLKYHWQYVDKPDGEKKSVALIRGSAAHLALSKYYSGMAPKQAIGYAWEEYAPYSDKSAKAMQELDFLLWRYMEWAPRNDGWKVLATEQTVEVKCGSHMLMGIWDLLVKKDGRTYIVDHKFQKSHSFANLEVDPQVTHYLALARLLNIPVFGLIYNIVNLETGKTENIALRKITTRTDKFLESYLRSLDPQIKEMKKAGQQKISIYPNWTKDCCWDCQFYRRCVDTPLGALP